MSAYLVRRLLIGCMTLGVITFFVYGLIRAMPGSPMTVAQSEMDPSRKLDPREFERMKANYGLDKPWHQAYFLWIGNVVRGDLGRSFQHRKPVAQLIAERAPPTLLLSCSSIALAYLIAIPTGLYSAARGGRFDERSLSTFLYALYSLPSFVAALLLQMTFAMQHNWLPLRGMVSDEHAELGTLGQYWDIAQHACLPLICLTYASWAYDSRFIRSNLMEVIRQDYIRTAQAKGVSTFIVLTKHAFRNTLIPLVTMLGLTLPALLSGSVIIEQIFTWPGMGRLFFESISARDYPVVMGLTLTFSTLTVLGTLLADVLYSAVDPRVRLS